MAIQYVDANADAVGTVNDTYNISGSNNQFSISIDGGSAQVFTLTSGSTRTAAQIVADLSALTSATASVVTINGVSYVRIRTSSANGNSSSILVNAPSNNANSALGFTATTYYGGAHGSTTFLGDTKQKIINGVEAALLTAGWITISGSGTTNLLMQSAMTPASANLRMRINLKDNGNNCTVISAQNVAATKAGGNSTTAGVQLFPQTGKGWQIIANKYQAFILVKGSTNARDFGCWGVPYMPSFVQGISYEAFWLMGNAQTDTSTGTGSSSFRTITKGDGTLQQMCHNGNLIDLSSTSGQGGQLALPTLQGAGAGSTPVYRWTDLSVYMFDPLISWGSTVAADEGLARGQLWNAFMASDAYPADTQVTSIDSHTWQAVMHNNKPTLFVMVS